MKTSKTYRIIACTLALLMFATSIGFAVDMHFCGDHLQSFSLFGEAGDCMGKEVRESKLSCRHDQHQLSGFTIDKLPCCNDRSVQVLPDRDQEVRSADLQLTIPLQQFITAFVLSSFSSVATGKTLPVAERYRPPLIPRDILVLVQSFRL